jgi:hypothetical protein
LRQVSYRGARRARGFAENLHQAGSRLHDASQNLESCGLAGAIGADEAENLALLNIQVDAPDRFHGTVVLAQVARANDHAIVCADLRRFGQRGGAAIVAGIKMAIAGHFRWLSAGHVSPATRMAPSAGIPGLA